MNDFMDQGNVLRHALNRGQFLLPPLTHIILLITIFFSYTAIAFGGEAILSWDPNIEPDLAGYKVYYGTASGTYGAPIDIGNLTTHTVTGLTTGTYFFAVAAYDTSGNESGFSNEVSKTISTPDTTPPVLSAIISGSTTSSSAMVTWTTDEVADSMIEYGTTTTYGSTTPPDPAMVTPHSQTITSLLPATTYHYRVISGDAAGNIATSGNNTFTTAEASPPPYTAGPLISGVAASNITINGAMITWGTDEPATAMVEYGPTTAYGNSTTENTALLTSHRQTLSGLLPNSIYHYRVRSVDTSSNASISGNHTFTTPNLTDTTPPGDVEGFTAVGGNRLITLTWTNPPDLDFVGVRIRYRTDGFPSDINDGTLLGDFTSQPNETMSTTHTGLSNGVTYFYLAASYDNQGNFQTTVFVSATPLDTSSNNPSIQEPLTGGCGMIDPMDGNPPGAAQAADMMALIGFIMLLLLKRACKLTGLQA